MENLDDISTVAVEGLNLNIIYVSQDQPKFCLSIPEGEVVTDTPRVVPETEVITDTRLKATPQKHNKEDVLCIIKCTVLVSVFYYIILYC